MINIDRVISILAILIALYAVYRDEFVNKNPILEVKTFPSNKYLMPKGCNPINKYQISFKIRNIGTSSIIGKGNYKNLLDDNLTLHFDNVSEFQIKLSHSDFPFIHSIKSSSELTLSFNQWMPHDSVNFVFDIELKDENKPFNVYVSNHQIKEGTVIYSIGKKDELPFYINGNEIYQNKDN